VRPLCYLFLVLLAIGCRHEYVSGRAPTLTTPAVARMIHRGQFHCTVWKVAEGLEMTAGHCCEDEETYNLEGEFAVPGAELSVLIDDDAHDVCVLRGEMRGAPIQLAPHDPPVGEVVWTAGYPRGIYLRSEGLWSGRSRIDDDTYDTGICSAVGGFGGSGSPIMDVEGRAVGVLSRRYQEMDNLMILSPIEWVRDALRRARVQPRE